VITLRVEPRLLELPHEPLQVEQTCARLEAPNQHYVQRFPRHEQLFGGTE